MPTFDDEPEISSMPRVFKTSKRASRVKKIESVRHREAAIRHRFDIDEKSLYRADLMSLYENLNAGKFPTNEQFCGWLQRLADLLSKKGEVRTASMKKAEQAMIENVVELLDAIRNFVETKNQNSVIQRFLYHLRLSSKSSDAKSKLKDLMSDQAFLDNAKDTLILLVTSSDFRDILAELSQVISGMFSRHVEQTLKESVQQDEKDQISIENRESVVNFLNLLDEIAENKDHQEALCYVLLCVRKSEKEIKQIVKSGSDSIGAENFSTGDANLAQAKKELQDFLEKVANRSSDDIQKGLSEITDLLKEDYKLRNILNDLVTFVERSLKDEDFRHDPDTILAGSNLIDQTRSYVVDICGETIQNLFKDFNDFLKAVQDDSHVQRLSQASGALLDHFYYKIKDRMVLNQDLVNDLAMLLLPNLLNQLRTITIPPIKTTTPKYEFQLEKFDLSVDDILPSYLEAKISKGIMMGIRDQITDQKYSSISIVLHELHIDASSIPFSYKLKSITLQDRGTLDLQTQKTGISVNLKLHYYAEDLEKTVEIENSDIFMDKIKLKIGGRHNTLYWLFNPAIKNMIRSEFSRTLQVKIQEYVLKVDKIVTARKVQYKRSNQTVNRQMRERRSSATPSVKDRSTTHEIYPWETNIFDLTYV